MRAVLYVRMSTDDQALSPAAQRASANTWAARAGVPISAEFADLGVSGKAPLDKRPGLVGALAELGKGDVLVVAKRDRLGRDSLVVAMVEAAVQRKGARVVSAAGEGTDDDDPTSVLMRRIVDAFSEYERLVIAARTRAALAVKRARGERTGSVPFGSELAPDGVHLAPLEDEQETIAEATRLRAAGMSLRAVAARLDEQGRRSRKGRPFAAVQVARMLARAGEARA